MRIRRVFDRIVVLSALAFVCWTTHAHGDDAAAMKKRGDDAFDARRFEEAVRAYEQAYGISQDAALLYNLGRAYEAIGRYPEALEHLTMFYALASAEIRKKTPKLDALIDDLHKRVATVRVKSNVAGARLIVRDVVVGRTVDGTTTIKVNAGDARVEVLKDGYAPWAKVVDLRGAATTTVDVVLTMKAAAIEPAPSGSAPAIAPKESPAKPTPSEPPASEKSIFTTWWFWTASAAVVVTGIIVIVVVTTEKDPPVGSFGTGSTTAPLLTF